MNKEIENSICICTWNNEKTIKRTLNDIIVAGWAYEIIIVDNNSEDKTREILLKHKKELGGIELVLLNKNIGEGAGVNLAMRLTSGKYVFKCDPDVFVPDNWIDKMKSYLISGVGVVVANSSGVKNWKSTVWNNRTELEIVHGSCFLLPRETINKCGYWSADYFYGISEKDYALKVREAGLRVLVASDVNIVHEQHNIELRKPITSKHMQEDSKRFNFKWTKRLSLEEPFKWETCELNRRFY